VNFKKFKRELRKEIVFYSLLNKIPITNITWEERVVNALNYSGTENVLWTPGSHQSGKDIKTPNYSFSCKSMFEKRGIARLSSFRTTTYPTIEEKINFIDNIGKNFTHYLIISRANFKKHLRYRVYMIEANYICAKNFNWDSYYSKNKRFLGWETDYINGLKLKIVKNMSAQLWIYIDVNDLKDNSCVRLLVDVSIYYKNLGICWKENRDRGKNGNK